MSSRPDEPAPRVSWWRRDLTARQVRILSVVALVAMGAGLVKPFVVPQQDGMDIGLMWLRVVGFLVASHIASNFVGGRAPLPGQLDERQRHERARALNVSYIVMAFCLCCLVLWAMVAGRGTMFIGGTLTVDPWVLQCLFLLHLMLPGSILAWREPRLGDED